MEQKSRSWWSTLPGLVTSVAGALTAITGLIVALNQAGCFKVNHDSLPTNMNTQAQDSTKPAEDTVAKKANVKSSQTKIYISKDPIHLNANPGGKIRYDILTATLESNNVQTQMLSIHFKIFDESGVGQKVLSTGFILSMDNLPPVVSSNADVNIRPNSSVETTAIFEVPLDFKSGLLKIIDYDQTAIIPITLH